MSSHPLFRGSQANRTPVADITGSCQKYPATFHGNFKQYFRAWSLKINPFFLARCIATP
jgi:hypothetical protein